MKTIDLTKIWPWASSATRHHAGMHFHNLASVISSDFHVVMRCYGRNYVFSQQLGGWTNENR